MVQNGTKKYQKVSEKSTFFMTNNYSTQNTIDDIEIIKPKMRQELKMVQNGTKSIKKYQNPKMTDNFFCEQCDYNTVYKSNYDKHCSTKKHTKVLKVSEKYLSGDNYHKKSTFFFDFRCVGCNYSTIHKSNYQKHCMTQKHKDKCVERNKTSQNTCDVCGKEYKYRTGLIRHQKNCYEKNNIMNITIEGNKKNHEEDVNLKSMFLTIMNENKELQTKLVEMAKEPKIVNHNVMNNKQFNIITFLNNDCRDAFNLSEFIENLKITFEDLHYIEQHGYIQGIKDSLVRSLAQMDETKRPIHCTDTKRKQFYVKDNNEWDKDSQSEKLNQALNMYNDVQLKTLLEWKKNNPEIEDNDQGQNRLNQILSEVTSMYQDQGDKIRNKIVNEIGNVTTIDKVK